MLRITYCFLYATANIMLALSIFLPNTALTDESPQIITSIKPLALITREITAGTTLKVAYLLEPTLSEHNYVLKLSDIKKLKDAKLVIWLGEDLEPYLKSTESGWRTTNKSLPLLEKEYQLDPHVWLNPILAQQLAAKIAARLSEINPENKQQFDANLTIFNENTLLLDKTTKQALKPHVKTPFFVYHEAYGYFVKHYELNEMGALHIQPDVGLSLKQINTMQAAIANYKNQKACLFREPQFATATIPRFEGNIAFGELDPLGIKANSYKELIDNLTKGFLDCFRQ